MSTNKNSMNLFLMTQVKYSSKSTIYLIYPPLHFNIWLTWLLNDQHVFTVKASSIFFHMTLIAFFKLVQTCMAGCTYLCPKVHP